VVAGEIAPEQEVAVIAGIHARRVRQELVPAIERLQDEGLRVVAIHPIHDLAGVAGMVSNMRSRGITRFVAAGGDGTVGAVVDSVATTKCVLGILPLGTSNDFARSLGLPLDIHAACRMIAHGKPRTIDIGLATVDAGARRYFAHAATVGVNSQFATLVSGARWRRRYGRLAYPVAAVKALGHRQAITMRIVADSRELRRRVVQATILNAPVFGGALELRVPDATLTDRRLDLIVVGSVTPRLLVRSMLIAVGGKRDRMSLSHLTHPKHIRIETDQEQAVYCDGELMGSTPVTIVSVARALTVIG
jgi:diacylglycerol kinase (ATP)